MPNNLKTNDIKKKKTKIIVALPLSEQPFFPSQVHPLLMNEFPWMESIKEIGDNNEHTMGLFFVNKQDGENINTDDFSVIGILAKMRTPLLHKHKIQFIAEGIQRIKIKRWISTKAPFKAEIEYLKDVAGDTKKSLKAYTISIVEILKKLMDINPLDTDNISHAIDQFNLDNPTILIDFAINVTNATSAEKQKILEENNIKKRLSETLKLLQEALEIAKIQVKIQQDVDNRFSGKQRDLFLREQLKSIKKELGVSTDDMHPLVKKYQQKTNKLTVPLATKTLINESLDKLSALESSSPEYTVTKNYLDWLTDLPWGISSKDILNLNNAKKVLNAQHYGMDKVKNRILEFIAVAKLKGKVEGSVILLVGAPGVGKTSIGSAIATALNRKFFRFSLGGMRDEAEIKGHRRTYIGAMPGKLISAFKQTKTNNPVIMLDEIDKIGNSYAGDPASALLEVLDPEQNVNFLDHYIDTPFDLSKTLFICTANTLHNIPKALQDRMEIIEVSGYIAEEKQQIAKLYLIKKQMAKNGLNKKNFNISTSAIRYMIDGYSREAGVRSLEQNINKLCRKAALKIARNKHKVVNITIKNIVDYLGQPIFDDDKIITTVGSATGLAWTGFGGATLTIETNLIHTKNPGFKITGQLGEVMQESVEIAYSYIRGNTKKYHIKSNFFNEAFVHIHVPAGAVPKDGPSAGMAMAIALLSLAKNKKIKRRLAMTGELTLTGKILPIGGLQEKIIAAKRQHISELLFPFANKRDFDELPNEIKKGITVHFVKDFAMAEKIIFPN